MNDWIRHATHDTSDAGTHDQLTANALRWLGYTGEIHTR